MQRTTGGVPQVDEGDPERPAGRGARAPRRAVLWTLGIVTPLVLFIVTQLDFAQRAEGWFIEGLVWDIGRKEIVADILAPVWVISIVVVAALERRMLDRYAGPAHPPEATPVPIVTERRARAATWRCGGCGTRCSATSTTASPTPAAPSASASTSSSRTTGADRAGSCS